MSDPVQDEDLEHLFEDEEPADLSEFSYREGLRDRDIIYAEESTTEWLSAEYSLDLYDWV